MYSDFEEAFIQTVDKHAPVKQRKRCQNPASFINKELRKAVYKKDSNSFISNILCHIYKEIIKTFCYHVLIIYDFIFFTEYDFFSKMATFVGNKRLDSRPKIL
jgi:hypothetical protein